MLRAPWLRQHDAVLCRFPQQASICRSTLSLKASGNSRGHLSRLLVAPGHRGLPGLMAVPRQSGSISMQPPRLLVLPALTVSPFCLSFRCLRDPLSNPGSAKSLSAKQARTTDKYRDVSSPWGGNPLGSAFHVCTTHQSQGCGQKPHISKVRVPWGVTTEEALVCFSGPCRSLPPSRAVSAPVPSSGLWPQAQCPWIHPPLGKQGGQ